MDLLIFLALLIFSGVLCFRSCRMIIDPERHVRDTMRKIIEKAQKKGEVSDVEPSSELPPLGAFRVIGAVGASATGITCGYLVLILWDKLTGPA